MTVVMLKGREAPKATRSAMETLIFSAEEIAKWKIPPFQRPIRVNDKVRALAEELKTAGGIIPGVLTIGRLQSDPKTYWLVDGQHRVEAFKIAALDECIADVRMVTFTSMGGMAEEFVNLNSALVRMRPDDVLRGLEGSTEALQMIRRECEFVGYGQIRRGSSTSAVLSMSALIRCWEGSLSETPSGAGGGKSVAAAAADMNIVEVERLVRFLQQARAAWGSDPENYRLWGNLNMTLCMWMWRRYVLDQERGVKRGAILSADDFRRCLMSVSADRSYIDWLIGRQMNDRDRGPGYRRLKTIFAVRIEQDTGKKPMLIQPAWMPK